MTHGPDLITLDLTKKVRAVGTDGDSDSAHFYFLTGRHFTSARYDTSGRDKPAKQNSSVIITYRTKLLMADGRGKLKLALWLEHSGQRALEEMQCHYM